MRKTYLLFLVALLFVRCEDVLMGPSETSNNHRTNFEYLWQQLDDKYPFFDIKSNYIGSWDAIHTKYSALVDANMSESDFFLLMGNMLNELHDGHINLSSGFNTSRFDIQSIKSPPTFSSSLIYRNYLPSNYRLASGIVYDFIINSKSNNHRIGYVRIGAFDGSLFSASLRNEIFSYFKDTKGLIIDIRQNGGGYISEMTDLLGHFLDKETPIYYVQSRNGKNHDDFTEPKVQIIPPSSASLASYLNKPVILLTDRGSFSASSFLAMAMRQLPRVTLVGDTTGGGLGLPNGGQLPNGWTYRFSISRTLSAKEVDANGKYLNYENGVPPHQVVRQIANATTSDAVVDYAILKILNP